MNNIEQVCQAISNLGAEAQTAFIVWCALRLLIQVTIVGVITFGIITAKKVVKIFTDHIPSTQAFIRMRDHAKIGSHGDLYSGERNEVEKRFYTMHANLRGSKT